MIQEKSLFKKLSDWYFSKRMLPYWVIMVADAVIVFLCCMFIYWVINKSQVTYDNHVELLVASAFYAVLSWIGARCFRTYSGVLRYSSFVDLLKVSYANGVNMALGVGFSLLFKWLHVPYLSLISPVYVIVAFLLATLVMWAFRVLVKLVFDAANSDNKAMRVLIYGAMTGGIGMAKYLRMQSPAQFKLRGFISHSGKLSGARLMGVRVYTMADDFAAIIKKEQIEALLVSPMRVEEFRQNQKIQDVFIAAGCKIFMAHDAQEANIKHGEILDSDNIQLKEVSVEDLLPRQEIRVDMKSVGEQLQGKRVLITGSAGSIGMEIVRQVAQFGPASMMLIDQAETPQHDVRLMMAKDYPQVPCQAVVCSISRRTRMSYIFHSFQPEYVFHAAAYKHVPMMEDNPSEAVLNNIYGTKVIADLSVEVGVKKFVMISTDKAVNPTNVMGCSKRICEIYVQSLDRKLKLQALEQRKTQVTGKQGSKDRLEYTQFVTTRFGNVLGSNGSVIPLFREQIKNGGPVTVTDENIVRFFMLIPEACKLVLEAGTKGNGGEIFVFDMGQPVKIADLAKRMIALSGARNVKIEYTGLREGEKLYEEVLNEMEGTKPTFHEKIRIAQVREYDYDEVAREIDALVDLAKLYNNMDTVRKMKEMVPEYKSNNSVYEQLDKELSDRGGV